MFASSLLGAQSVEDFKANPEVGLNRVITKESDGESITLDVALFRDSAFTDWKEALPEATDGDSAALHFVAGVYSDYSLALILDVK